ncbi:MAG: class I SAM-dependent methyltransferase [Polyangiales bacterium]
MSRTKSIDHALRVGSAAHYDDARYYAHAYRDRADDVALYVGKAIERSGPILEYGCGAGRITLPLAHAGADVTGVDASKPMLDELRARLLLEPPHVRARVTVRPGDMRAIALKSRYAQIFCTFNTFLHLYTRDDVERFLSQVCAHLAPGGRFVFDASVPNPIDLARDASKLFRTRPFVHPTLGRRVKYGERFDYESLRQVLHVTMEFEPEGAPEETFVTPLTHRQFFPAELEALLHYNGLRVVDQQDGFTGTPLTATSDAIVWTCEHR